MIRTMSLSLLAGAAVSFGATGVALGETDAPAGASSDEVRALVADMLADAETRSSLLQSGGTAGHDGKFFLASPDGAFRMNISGQMQIRYIANFRDEGTVGPADPGAPYDDFESGFQNRRMKLVFDGHVYNDFFYKIQFEFGRTGGGAVLQDAFVGYEFENGLKLRAGQFKLPFLREELVQASAGGGPFIHERDLQPGSFAGHRARLRDGQLANRRRLL
jgi:phosphate-selective porin